jgi:hypothetical protein
MPPPTRPITRQGLTRVPGCCWVPSLYGRAVDYTILPALSRNQQSKRATTVTAKACDRQASYLATHPMLSLRFYAGGMVLCIVSECSLSRPA